MASLVAPTDIAAIFDKPGALWTPEERTSAKRWLNVPPQLRVWLRRTAAHLGYGTTAEDAEDTWQAFCTSRLDDVIDGYDPGLGRHFLAYVSLCLARDCWKIGNRLRQQRAGQTSIDPESSYQTALDIRSGQADNRREAVRACVESLPAMYRAAIDGHYFSGWSVSEMAVALGMTESNVKIRLFRARKMLKDCLGGGS